MIRIAIIGSGFAGIGMAIQLARAGFSDVTLYEQSDRLGGTWRDNRYPGAACDVPSHLYSFSFEPKHDWSRKFAPQDEILAYLEHCADKHGVRDKIRFGTTITAADFDDAAGRWTLRTAAGESFQAHAVITALGQLGRPAIPELPGAERFSGPRFHSARWDHDAPLAGKNVAVVGTGASAIQFVPRVAAVAEKLTLFQRTPPWIAVKPDRVYRDWEKTLFARVPALQKLHRWLIYWTMEMRFVAFKRGSVMNGLIRRLATKHLHGVIADPQLRAALTPDYPAGCKRVLISDDYYQALARPNVEVVTAPISDVEPDAVVAGGTRHPADALIYGTGFHATEILAPLRITGRGGRDLDQAWRDGAEAFLGISVAGFPNLFVLYGPNTNLAHNSIIFMLEAQIRYIVSCLRALAAAGRTWLDVRDDAMRDFNRELSARLERAVWAEGCTSWYKTASGRNPVNWPGFTVEYWRRTRRVDLDNYDLG